ncbi:hypothetical protein MN0502_18800 [Arthrobacter sp. MN05-02]|nr:hypothetical protein MN0502_18800 [Arthrobacter sp. MN05-02]
MLPVPPRVMGGDGAFVEFAGDIAEKLVIFFEHRAFHRSWSFVAVDRRISQTVIAAIRGGLAGAGNAYAVPDGLRDGIRGQVFPGD